MARVGCIGLGLMGAPMARNLLRAGHDVVVHNRSRKIVDELVSEGAIAATSPREVAAQVDFVFSNLPDSPDVEKVALGEDGVIAGAHDGLVFIDNSTIKPESARIIAEKLAEAGVDALDAPVSGGPRGAIAGTLTIMVGGPELAFNKALPVLQAVGATITHIGESGAGQIAKAANQIMCASAMVAMAEALMLSQRAGVDPEKVVAAISKGAAQCWTLDTKPSKLFRRDHSPDFKAYMQAKDLKIVIDTGRVFGTPLMMTALLHQLFEAQVAMGHGELDNSAVIRVLEELTGTLVGQEPDAASD